MFINIVVFLDILAGFNVTCLKLSDMELGVKNGQHLDITILIKSFCTKYTKIFDHFW